MSCGTGLREWFHEAGSGDASLELVEALTTEERTVREVGSSMCWIGGGLSQWANRHQNQDRTQVFRSFRVCRGRGALLHPPLSRSPAWFPTQQRLCHGTQLSTICTVSHTDHSSHPHTTTATTCLSCFAGYRHIPPTRPDPILLSLPSLTLLLTGLPRRCLGLC